MTKTSLPWLATPAPDDLVELAERRRRAEALHTIAFARGGRSHTIRPLSAGALLAFFRAVDGGERLRIARFRLLASAFVNGPRFFGPALTLMRQNVEENETVADTLIRSRGVLSASLPDAAAGAIGRWRTAGAVGDSSAILSLANAVSVVQDTYGAAWYQDAPRWRTPDGTPPARLVWIEAFAIRATQARTIKAPPPAPLTPAVPLLPPLGWFRRGPSSLN